MENEDKPQDLKSVLDIRKIKKKSKKRGFSPKEINNIMGGNYIRILNENLK